MAMKKVKALLFLVEIVQLGNIHPLWVLQSVVVVMIVRQANIQRKQEIPRKANATIVKQIHLVPNLDEANCVTRVKKERHQHKVQPFVFPVMPVPI